LTFSEGKTELIWSGVTTEQMNFLTAASDRSSGGLSGGVSGPSFFGASFFCGVALVAMSLSTAGAEPAPVFFRSHERSIVSSPIT
jgi:hypothetical protein